MVTIQQVNEAIMFGDFTNEQLNAIAAAIKYRRNQIGRALRRSVVVGSRVRFVGRGQYIMGDVTKIGTKNVYVKSGPNTWRVPSNILELVP